MVHLTSVGNHRVQHDAHETVQLVLDERWAFDAHVAELIATNDFALLAEEFSDEALKMAEASQTTLQQFATAKGIEHRFCDPNLSERNGRGIGDDHDERERFWLERIDDSKDRDILFVCGDDHFDSFAAKLIAAGFDVQRGLRGRLISKDDLIEGARPM